MSTPKILMTADAVGGVWRYSVDLLQGLSARGVEILLATMGPRPSEDQKRQISAIPNVVLAESDYALEWMPDPWADVDRAGQWLVDLTHDFHPDIIHLNGYSHAALAWPCPTVVVAHSCVFSWWRAVHGCAPGSEWDSYRRRVLAGLHSASAVLSPSTAMAHAITEEYGTPFEAIRVIHNFSDTAILPSAPKQPFFLAAGRVWDPAKNVRLLEKIAPRLHWELRVSGDGGKPQKSKSVRFLGMLPYSELLQQMSLASVFLHPALYEPFGLSVLEAARQRCCLVLADIPSLRELWSGAALFIDPRNPDAWVDELNNLTSRPEKIQKLADRAQSHAACYSSAASISQYQSVYEALLTSHKQPRSGAAA